MKNLILSIALLLTFCVATFESKAQVDLKSVYSLTSDTVTNTATITLTSPALTQPASQTVVQVNVTKISGTVGGPISLHGSLDGTNFKALNTVVTQTALATITATDASNVYHWRLTGSPFKYYRVSWTGTGTMSASFTSKVLAR
jgi:hypothetical protein